MLAMRHRIQKVKTIVVIAISATIAVASVNATAESMIVEDLVTQGINSLVNGGDLVEDIKQSVAHKIDGYVESGISNSLSNTEVTIEGITDDKPTISILTTQPIHESEDLLNTIFGQASLFHYDGRQTINLGLGYRRMSDDEHWLYGVNGFYDHEFPYDHQRSSIGFEARSSVIDFNTNKYFGLSDWRSGENGNNEKALDGYDIEVGMGIPYMPNGKIFHKQFEWNAENGVSDMEGNTTSLLLSGDILFPDLSVEIGATDYRNQEDNKFIRLTYSHTPDSTPKMRPLFSSTMYRFASMKEHRLDKVRRQNKIIKQKSSSSDVYNAAASIGDLFEYSLDTSSLTYSYTITSSEVGLTGTTGSGTLADNGDGTYTPSTAPNTKVMVLPNKVVVGATTVSVNGQDQVTLLAGVPSASGVTLSEIADTYNYVALQCQDSPTCNTYDSFYGTFNVTSSGVWVECTKSNYDAAPTSCAGRDTGTLTTLGNGKFKVLDSNSTDFGTAMFYRSGSGQKIIIVDLKDTSQTGYGRGMLIGVPKQAVTYGSSTNGKWNWNTSQGNSGYLTATGTSYVFDGGSTGTFTTGTPWEGFFTAEGGTGMLADEGIYIWAKNSGTSYIVIGVKE